MWLGLFQKSHIYFWCFIKKPWNKFILLWFRLEDLKARDEFHQRMIAKDKEKQRNIVTKSDKRAYEEAAKRLAQVHIFHEVKIQIHGLLCFLEK